MMTNILHKTIPGILLCVAAAAAHADFKPYTPEELAEWEATCAKDPKCASAWEGLKKKQAERNTELEKACTAKPKECQARVEARAYEMLREFAECKEADSCIKHINETAGPKEKLLVDGSWCNANPRVCSYVKSRREQRIAKKKEWCDDYTHLCQQAHTQRVQITQQYEQHLDDMRREAEQKRAVEVRKRIEEGVALREKSLATCVGDAAQCDREINQKIAAESQMREEQWCKKSEELCAVAKSMRKERESRGSSWCNEHADECAKAQATAKSRPN